MHSQRVVLLAGASGLVGAHLLERLASDISVGEIRVLSRNPIKNLPVKATEILIDFSNPSALRACMDSVHVVFCCIGTTLKKAGSKEAFREVDYSIPLRLAQAASDVQVPKFIAVSSVDADPGSSRFYLRTKGEMERDIGALPFTKLAFIRPSLLLGSRAEFRPAEQISAFFMRLFAFAFVGPLKKYRAVPAETVAKAMLSVSHSINNQRVYEGEVIHWLGRYA